MLIRLKLPHVIACLALACCSILTHAQVDTIVIGFGGFQGATVTASDAQAPTDPESTLDQSGYLPNENAASRFLAQATLGYNLNEIELVKTIGIEDWIQTQFGTPRLYNFVDKTDEYLHFVRDSSGVSDARVNNRMWDYTFWQYLMTSPDHLRQRVAFALSEIFVISENSNFRNNGFALSKYYDILLDHSFGNYKDLLNAITYNASMGAYLTFINNPKTDTINNKFPDENYAREIMQLFSIGTVMLNDDGTVIVDSIGVPVPTYSNYEIVEFAKIFTGLTWGDRTSFGRGAIRDSSYIFELRMFDDKHEPGVKNLLNGYQVIDRNPVDGKLDIADALENIFQHQNVPPFICKQMIQRLVTANPPPEYVQRVVDVFKNDGNGVRGNLRAVTEAILLDPFANSCQSGESLDYGSMREPFLRYVQLNKAFNATTVSGNYRNDMDYVYRFTNQRPLAAETVFNFFQPDFQPIGAIEAAGKVGPVFQIMDAQTLAGYVNGLYRWLIEENVADEYDIYNGEINSTYEDELSQLDLTEELLFTDHNELHILLDRLNLLLAQGRVADESISIIINALKEFPNETADQQNDLVRLAIYLFMTSPEYLINR